MPFTSFPTALRIKTMDTSETVHLGGFTFARDQELEHIRVTLYKHGTAGGSERIRAKLFHDADMTKLYATGDYATVSEAISGATRWLGKVRLDFTTPPNIEAGEVYHIGIEASSYTRSASTFYLGFALDYPLRVNTYTASAPVLAECYGRREVKR